MQMAKDQNSSYCSDLMIWVKNIHVIFAVVIVLIAMVKQNLA